MISKYDFSNLDKLYNVFLNNNDSENTYNMNTLLEFYYNMKLNGYYSTLEYYKLLIA